MTDKDLLKISNYIIENHATFDETALYFNCSLRNYMKELKARALENINSDINWQKIVFKIEEIKQENEMMGKIKGGQTGKRKSKWSDEDIELIARTILKHGWTLREAQEGLGEILGERFAKISKSTIHELLLKLQDEDLQQKIRNKYYETLHNPEIAQKRK